MGRARQVAQSRADMVRAGMITQMISPVFDGVGTPSGGVFTGGEDSAALRMASSAAMQAAAAVQKIAWERVLLIRESYLRALGVTTPEELGKAL
jgi:hypothetical protein